MIDETSRRRHEHERRIVLEFLNVDPPGYAAVHDLGCHGMFRETIDAVRVGGGEDLGLGVYLHREFARRTEHEHGYPPPPPAHQPPIVTIVVVVVVVGGGG